MEAKGLTVRAARLPRSSLPAAAQAGQAEGGEAGRHRHPGRGLGDGWRCSEDFRDIDLAAPGPDPSGIARACSAVERATAPAAIDRKRLQNVVKLSFSSPSAAIAAAAAQAKRTDLRNVGGVARAAATPAAESACASKAWVSPVVSSAALSWRKAAIANVIFPSAGAVAREAAAAPAPIKSAKTSAASTASAVARLKHRTGPVVAIVHNFPGAAVGVLVAAATPAAAAGGRNQQIVVGANDEAASASPATIDASPQQPRRR
jgi:hypothetical protein